MAPLLMCIVCGVYCYRKKQLEDDPNWKMAIPSRTNSRSTLRNVNSDGSEMEGDGTLKKSRSYDKVYRTHEPLDGKPNTEFPEKRWDLDDDADVTSSEGSEFTRPAKDIEYVNKEDRPKQTGRRSLNLKNYQPIQEEGAHSRYPEPMESPSPVNYSPTYSGLDRNSSFLNDPQAPVGGQRVLPAATTFGNSNNNNPNNNKFFGGPSSPPPPLTPGQDVGLPQRVNSHSTEV